MLFSSYLRNGVVYVPTVVKLQTGAYVDVEPVAVTAVGDTEGLRRTFLDAIARKNAVVPPPPKTKRTAITKLAAIETIPTDIGRRTPRKKSTFHPGRGLKR